MLIIMAARLLRQEKNDRCVNILLLVGIFPLCGKEIKKLVGGDRNLVLTQFCLIPKENELFAGELGRNPTFLCRMTLLPSAESTLS